METISAQLLSRKLSTLGESATIKMAQKARELKNKGFDVISLSLGEPDFDTPTHIKEAAKEALDDGFTKYTPVPGLPVLREAISAKFKRDNDLNYTPDQILVSNGAKQSVANVCLALLNPEDEVILFTPYWVSYFEIVKFAGGTPVLLSASLDQNFKISAEQLAQAITPHTKAIIFSSPCNPTGSVYSRDELISLTNVLHKHEHVMVISDEIYEYINFTDDHVSIGALPGMQDRTITINGMSKGFAMTGWRIGYMGAPKWVVKACAKIQGQITSGAASFSQKASAVALNSDLAPTYKMRDAFLKRKYLVIKGLQEIEGIKVNDPEGAFYVFPEVNSFFGKSNGTTIIENADEMAEILLEQAHVGVVSGSAFGNDDCIRISYAASEAELTEAISRIKRVLDTFK